MSDFSLPALIVNLKDVNAAYCRFHCYSSTMTPL